MAFLVQLFLVWRHALSLPLSTSCAPPLLQSVLLTRSSSLFRLQVLQASDLPAGLVSIVPGARDQLTAALANHNVIKAIWYWGGPEVKKTEARVRYDASQPCYP